MNKIGIAALAALIASGCAYAAPDREAVQMSVSVSEIHSSADAKIVLGELEIAAARACIESDTWTRRTKFADNRRCISEAIESGVKAVNDPLLTDAWKDSPNG
jgi:UrcA family protein